MSLLNANVARFFFETADLPANVFEVARFSGVEEISRLYSFTFDLFSEDASIDFTSVINKTATFRMMRGVTPVPVQGLVIDFRQLGRTRNHVAYRAVLAPRLWRLSLHYRSRVFQHMTVEDIITRILQEAEFAPADFRFELSGSYEAREYCVQFEETDLNFVMRLLEHEGISFFFEHNNELETLVMTDDQSKFPVVEDPNFILYHETEGLDDPVVEVVHAFTCREQITPGVVTMKDYNYETPDDGLNVMSFGNPDMPGEYYYYGQHYKTGDQGSRLGTARAEALECRRRVLEGVGNCVGFRNGHIFGLVEHYRSDFDEDYLLVQVRHEGSQRHAMGLDVTEDERTESGVLYRNRFQCQQASTSFRPEQRTRVPKIPGVMIAHVEHPQENADDYGHLDDQGRYRARMDFDQGDAGPADATLPMRMNQPYSGPGYGVHFPNHHDTEMIFACVNGDIDRPMALGTVPNPNQASPSTVANKWQSVIRTWGRNELTFDDKVGEENIYMHATKNHTVVVRNNESISVGNDQSITVGNDRTKSVGNDETNTIKNDRTTTVEEGDDTLNVTLGDRTVNVDTGDATLNVKTGDRTVNVNTGDYTVNVKTGNRTINVPTGQENHTVQGTYDLESVGAMTIKSSNNITIESPTQIEIKVGGSSIKITPASIELSSILIKSTASAMNEMTGPMIKSEAAGINNIKGGLVTINP